MHCKAPVCFLLVTFGSVGLVNLPTFAQVHQSPFQHTIHAQNTADSRTVIQQIATLEVDRALASVRYQSDSPQVRGMDETLRSLRHTPWQVTGVEKTIADMFASQVGKRTGCKLEKCGISCDSPPTPRFQS
jgi:hypothetical protein